MRAKPADWEPANLPHPHVHDDTGDLVPTCQQMFLFKQKG